jgi:glycosyltransferase involved in cell wall biosynthesis
MADLTENITPLVSIACITYNHAGFIRDAMEGFLMQKTTFPFEILIHDDASTDGTAEIIREYEEKYPGLIFPLYQSENQYSKGVRGISTRYNIPRARGKYIAICEGDDYWTDPLKLQRQVDFLQENEEYVAVAENGMIFFTENNEERLFSKNPARDLCIEEMIMKRRFPTASVVFRKQAISNYLNEVKLSNDTIIWCYLASKGKFRYNTEVSSVYRRGLHGVVLSTETIKWIKIVENWNLEYIRLFSPKYFNKKIAIKNIWDHYWKAYKSYKALKQRKKAMICLYHCYKYDFMTTVKKTGFFTKLTMLSF